VCEKTKWKYWWGEYYVVEVTRYKFWKLTKHMNNLPGVEVSLDKEQANVTFGVSVSKIFFKLSFSIYKTEFLLMFNIVLQKVLGRRFCF